MSYIETYKYIAISEMHRSGIPASIKLAQGLLESMVGNSPLAINANNHFGIKCKENWDGEIYYHVDDDKDHKGQLTHSCFRSYNAPELSFVDHTEFLLNRSRYKNLFRYSKKDYVSWAYGLKRCGYATDPLYAAKLIQLIEKFELYKYDRVDGTDAPATETATKTPAYPVELIKIDSRNK